MAITNKQRLDLIEEYIREHKYADLHTLSNQFDISLSTVRRALNDLEHNGNIRRHHGGASWVEEEPTGGYDFITQDDRNAEAKHTIAHHIAKHIETGMTVLLDGGTTTYNVARLLVNKRLIVITNSLPIAALFNEVSTCETILTGGTIYNRIGILYGPACENTISQIHANVAILGSAGITAEGIWNSNSLIVSAQQKMLKAADQGIFAIDSSKFGQRALTLATGFSKNMTIVTEKKPLADIEKAANEHGTKIEVAK